MTLRVLVRSKDDAAALLDERRWLEFSGEPAEVLRQNANIFRAYCDAIDQPASLVTAWDGDRLAGAAIVLVEEYARGRRLLSITFPGVHHRTRARGLWLARDVDAPAVLRVLLEAVLAARDTLGASRVSIQECPVTDPLLPEIAQSLGFVSLPGPNDFHIEVPAGGWEGFLASLPRRSRWNLRNDLRRAAEAGAIIETLSPLPDALWDELWPLQLDTYARKGSHLRGRAPGLFHALRASLPAADCGAVTCRLDGKLLGFTLYHRAGERVRWPYVGHVVDPPLHVYSALVAAMLHAEIERGVRLLMLGYGGDVFKTRIGAGAEAQVSLYRGP